MTQRQISGGNVNYVYDGDGGLLKKTEPGATSLYVGGIYELRNSTATKYYSVAGETIAMRKGLSIVYLLNDHLGSNTTLVSLAGAVTGTMKYWPFGMTRATTGTISTDKLYTGQQQEPGDVLELYHYNARVYSTLLGRFLSVDPIVGRPGNSQSWNAYAYVLNNPLKFVDPTGMDAASDWVNSGSIGKHRNTGCGYECQQLNALAAVGWSAEQWSAWQHQQVVGALAYLGHQAAIQEDWRALASTGLSSEDWQLVSLVMSCIGTMSCGPSEVDIIIAQSQEHVRQGGAAGLALCSMLSDICDVVTDAQPCVQGGLGSCASVGVPVALAALPGPSARKLGHLGEGLALGRRAPPVPSGMTQSSFGAALHWGTTNEEALRQIGRIERDQLVALGVTKEMAEQWRDFYLNVAITTPNTGNPSAAGRAWYMQYIVQVLE